MATSLGEKIRRHRQEKGFSLDKLAELTESSKSYIWELENRDTRKPSAEKLTRIAQALSVTTDYLLDESATPTDQFWSVGERVDEIVKILRSCFDGHSRSRMMHYLMIMYRHGILTEGDMEGFSEEARGRLERYIGFLKEDARQDG